MPTWNDRHHVAAEDKPLPEPKKNAIRSMHGGPILPRVSTRAPQSMAAPISKHYRPRAGAAESKSSSSDRSTGSRAGPAPHPEAKVGSGGGREGSGGESGEGGGRSKSAEILYGPDASSNERLEAVRAELEAARAEMASVQNLAQRHQAALVLRNHQQQAPSKARSACGAHPRGRPAPPRVLVADRGAKVEPGAAQLPAGGKRLTPSAGASAPKKGRNNRDAVAEGGPSDLKESRNDAKAESHVSGEEIDGSGAGAGAGILSLDIEGIKLDNEQLGNDKEERANYRMSESGTIHIDSFEIRRSGMVRTPADDVYVGRSSVPGSRAHREANELGVHESMVVLGVLGHGASSVVHKALHVPTLRLVAQKNIPVFDEEKRRQMVRELRALYHNLVPLTSLEWTSGSEDSSNGQRPTRGPSCPCIVSFYDAYMDPHLGNISIIVEYMDGGSLQDIVDTGGCDCESVLANISFRVLTGLAFLHARHQIHRDIKPANLLINHLGHVKVRCEAFVRMAVSLVSPPVLPPLPPTHGNGIGQRLWHRKRCGR
jgi:hypothetical protein